MLQPVTEAVQRGQDSRSVSTAHTVATGAAISMAVSMCTNPSVT